MSGNIRVGSKQNSAKTLESSSLIKNLIKESKSAGLKTISKVLLSKSDVTYLKNQGYETIALGSDFVTHDQFYDEFGKICLVSSDDVTPETVVLRPFCIVLEHENK